MSLNVVMGNGQHDLRSEMLTMIQQQFRQNELLTVFYIVPNHVKFDSEVNVLQRFSIMNGNDDSELYAQSRLQVYSLTRLAWALMKNTPDRQPDIVEPTGLFMIVSNILREQSDILPVFSRMQTKSGFVSALVAQLVELRASNVTPENLLEILEKSADNIFLRQTLNAKLHDLAIVADDFNARMGENQITGQETLIAFAKQLADLKLSNVAFYFDGFNGFTSAEMMVVNQLITTYPVTMGILGDPEKMGQQREGDVFFKPMTTVEQLSITARTAQQEVAITAATKMRPLSRTAQQVLGAWACLGEYRNFTGSRDEVHLNVFAAENPITEIKEVARRIRRSLVDDPTLHLRDIIILSRDLTPYQAHIEAVMSQFELPYFLDMDVNMMNHPLVELILNLLAPNKFQYQTMLAILKTGLLRPTFENKIVSHDEFFDIVSHMDNYLYAYRPYESRWRDFSRPFKLFQVTRDDDDTEISEDEKVNNRLEYLRHFIVEAFDELDDGFAMAKNLRQSVTHLVLWLQKYHVTDALLEQRDDFIAQGNLSRSQQSEEVWQMLTKTLDEMVEIDGERGVSLTDIVTTLQAGLSGAKFSGIPNNLDQLMISEAGIVQNTQYKQLYFIGGTRQNLPAQVKNAALINDAERSIVQPALQSGTNPRYLQNTAQQQMAEENLLFYGSLMSSIGSITLSYPILEPSGQLAEMSSFFKRLVDTFNSEVKVIGSIPSSAASLLKQYVGTARATLSDLVKILPVYGQTAAFKAVQNVISNTMQDRLERVLSAPNYQNNTTKLKPKFISALFGERLNVSISQLESYYSNPFAYFLQYGLKLQERATNELNVAQTGTLYHAVFENVLHELIVKNKSLRDITGDELRALVRQHMQSQLALPAFEILNDSGKMRATTNYLTRVCETLVLNLQAAARENTSKPEAVEQLFGFSKESLPPLSFARMQVRGKLDRFDKQDVNGEFGTIIDYKSNGKTFNWGQAYDGLQMQLLTYWDAAQQSAEKLGVAAIGGAFFAKISPEKTKITDKTDLNALFTGKLIPETFKYRGLFISEPAYVSALTTLEPQEKSAHYPVVLLKNGALGKIGVDAVDPDEFALLLQRNRENIITAGDLILSGYFPIMPVEGGLTYSPYLDIIRFDRALGDAYKVQSPADKNTIIKLLKGGQD
ncbi:PD-(D/E)XK nuclease family protein [Leuconostoc mesenteroides]|uniref:PD-(D/E)XK nuclease family protein n=1 Tax=Leuconostoc mesenteroides TaxID=1245 RepID=UPI000B9D7555|nr:PD-(D/E)XK nuclease family protein [Leuconostoc mesenteroides]BAX73182.1 ATP-dependent nuclease subunit B [Leuconostoc mesenteroides]